MKKRFLMFFSMLIVFSIILTSCKGKDIKVLDDGVNKSKQINYSKQEFNVNIGLAGIGFDIKALGEIDKKSKSSIMDVSTSSPLLDKANRSMKIYSDKESLYIKDSTVDKYTKISKDKANNQEKMFSTIAEIILPIVKDSKSFTDSLKISGSDEKDVSANIEPDVVKAILNSELEKEGALSTIEAAIEAQLISMSSQLGPVNASKEEIASSAKEEAKKATLEYKAMLKQLSFDNINYKATINKDGYLVFEKVSLDIKGIKNNMTLKLKVSIKQSEINANKSVKIPEIPQEKIVNL